MKKLNQAAAWASRAVARLLPAGRGWGAAIWTEAHVVPRGLERLAWRAGGGGRAGHLARPRARRLRAAPQRQIRPGQGT